MSSIDLGASGCSETAAEPLRALQDLLGSIVKSNCFYQGKLAEYVDQPLPRSLDDFSARVPLTTKAELVADQAANPPYGSNLSCSLTGYTRCHQTSGTTGNPIRWLDTAESWSAMTDDWTEIFKAAGISREDRIFFAFSFGPFLGFWLAFEAAGRLGCLAIPGGGMSSAQRVRVLLEHSCTVLCCTPSYALHLAETSRTLGLDPTQGRVRLLVVAGEPGGSIPSVRKQISAAWNGARVFDHHGMTETGPVTYENPKSPGDLLILERSFFVEVIDPLTTRPVIEGQLGELVLTTLRRFGSPLIRYRTGDLVLRRHFQGHQVLEGGILGRVDDMVVVRGVNVYPSALDALIRKVEGTAEYRVTVDRRASLIELSIELEGDTSVALAVAQCVQYSLALRVTVVPVIHGSLPRFELKARRWQTIG
ncbi:MAG: phenylacetate--CoA ligase family protein [Pedosphaera sp.]|nr:phenylacetate--CoA ligase family protein [Pedosphaera sp.]